jgi:hypothetical protein
LLPTQKKLGSLGSVLLSSNAYGWQSHRPRLHFSGYCTLPIITPPSAAV